MLKNFLIVNLIVFSFFSSLIANEPKNFEDWKDYFTENALYIDDIEGIYISEWYNLRYRDGKLLTRNKDSEMGFKAPFFVIRKENNRYARYNVTFKSSRKIDFFIKSSYGNRFSYRPLKYTGDYTDNPSITYEAGFFKLTYTLGYQNVLSYLEAMNRTNKIGLSGSQLQAEARRYQMEVEHIMTKYFPDQETINQAISKKRSISGTGFAISSDIIVTTFHTVENANKVSITGINGDFNKNYDANVLQVDRNNDLAILQINDSQFAGIKNIPYTIIEGISSVGDDCFVMGYPMRATMGDEIKLTNGIISSRTGYQGDVTSYQITAPVQPGNSGAPVFNYDGSLIGIITSKHIDAENVSYAIKANYLINLIDLLPLQPSLPLNSNHKNKNLSEKASIIKNFVYIIEVD